MIIHLWSISTKRVFSLFLKMSEQLCLSDSRPWNHVSVSLSVLDLAPISFERVRGINSSSVSVWKERMDSLAPDIRLSLTSSLCSPVVFVSFNTEWNLSNMIRYWVAVSSPPESRCRVKTDRVLFSVSSAILSVFHNLPDKVWTLSVFKSGWNSVLNIPAPITSLWFSLSLTTSDLFLPPFPPRFQLMHKRLFCYKLFLCRTC